MSRSDVFDEYAKIAEEMGLVSSAEDEGVAEQPGKPKESAKLKRYKKSPYPRVGSDDISTIEALYGVKPDNSVKYENNIMEAAHPKPVVIGPSYDRINALVENNIERQNIICNLVSKPNDGNLNYKKWAQKDLMMQLVRVANDLDNAGHEELCALADKCIEEVSEKKKFKKADIGDWLKSKENWLGEHGRDAFEAVKGYGTGALVGGILGGIVGGLAGEGVGAIPGFMTGARLGGVAGGLVASIARTSPHVVNVAENAKDTISQIQDLVNKIPAGSTENKFLVSFQQNLRGLAYLANSYNDIASSIEQTHTDATSEDAQKAQSITKELFDYIAQTEEFSKNFNDKVNRQVYQQFVEHSKLLTPVYEFISDDVEDVQDSLRSLQQAINNFKLSMTSVHEEAKSAVSQEKPTEKASKPEAEEEAPEESESEEEPEESSGYEEISQLIGHKPSDRELDFFRSLK